MTGTDHDHATEAHEHQHGPDDQVRRWIDYLGAGVGLLCAVHCALTPMALVLSPIAGLGALWSETGEGLMLWSLVALALISGGAAAMKSGRVIVAVGFLLSISLVFVSHELAEHEHSGAEGWPLLLSVLGGVGVMLCHLWSLKLQRSRSCCDA